MTQETSVAIIGAGRIGLSWSVVFARAGRSVHLYDADGASLEQVALRVGEMVSVLVDGGVASDDEAAAICSRIVPTPDLAAAVADVVWVQECVPEDLEVKRRTFGLLDTHSPEVAIIASSTSAIPMTQIAAGLAGARRCVVVHPTNPPHLLPFCEVVGGIETDTATIDAAITEMQSVGQIPVACAEIPGFVLNRLQVALEREAMYLVETGACTVGAVEAALVHGLGPRWAALGPFGVEETNSDDVVQGLIGYRHYFDSLFAELPGVTSVSDELIAKVGRARGELLGTMKHDELVRWRDRTILAIRSVVRR